MNSFKGIIIFAALVACSGSISAGPSVVFGNDFSTSDSTGGYHFGFNDGRLARQEERTPDGIVRGAYSYIDANGKTQTVSYTADDHNGFLASGTNIPKVEENQQTIENQGIPAVVEETPEVKAAKAEHFEAHRRVLQTIPISVPATVQFIEDTPEVKAAQAKHFKGHRRVVQAIPIHQAPIETSVPVFVQHVPLPVQCKPTYSPVPIKPTYSPVPIKPAYNLGHNAFYTTFPTKFASTRDIQYLAQHPLYHPDYLPYAHL